MSKSHPHPLTTEKKQPQPNSTRPATNAGKNTQQNAKRKLSMSSRWLHIYVSMISFVIVLFFAVTGITLNHADKFAYQQRTRQLKGTLNTAWVKVEDTSRINKLAIVEYLRNTHKIKSALSEFRIDDAQCSLSFKGPGYGSDAFINREDGTYEITEVSAGFVGLINDLHKGRDTGTGWLWVIDLSAVFMILVSLTGIILLLFIKKRKTSGLIVAVAGGILFLVIYYLCA